MKSVLLVILLYTTLVLISGNSFEKIYPLYGLEDISDQLLLETPEGDEYFFAIVDGSLKVKKREFDTDFFDDYIVDFSSLNLNNVIDIELAVYRGNIEVIYLITEKDNSYDIVKLTFEKDIIIADVIETYDYRISNLQVLNSHENNIVLSYVLHGSIHLCSISNDGKINSYNIGITDQYIKLYSYYNFHELNEIIQLFYFTFTDEHYHLWYLEIDQSEISKQYVKTVNIQEIDSFTVDLRTGIKCFYTKGINRTYFRIIDNKCCFVIATSEFEQGYYEVGEEVIYCIKSNNDLIRLDTLSIVTSIYTLRDSTLYKSDTQEIAISDNNIYSFSNNREYNNTFEEYDLLLPMGNFLMSFRGNNNGIFTFYHVGENKLEILNEEVLELLYSNIEPVLDTKNDCIKMYGTDYILSLTTYHLYKLRKKMVRLKNYIFYEDERGFYYLGVDK